MADSKLESPELKRARLNDRKVYVSPGAVWQEVNVSKNFIKFSSPFRMLIAGPSMCGKSHFCKLLIKYRKSLISGNIVRVCKGTKSSFSFSVNQENVLDHLLDAISSFKNKLYPGAERNLSRNRN